MSDTATKPYFAHVRVPLKDKVLSVFGMVALVCDALRKSGVSEKEVEEFRDDALSDDRRHADATVSAWVTVE